MEIYSSGSRAMCIGRRTNMILPIRWLRNEGRADAICPWNFQTIHISWARANVQWAQPQLRSAEEIDYVTNSKSTRVIPGPDSRDGGSLTLAM